MRALRTFLAMRSWAISGWFMSLGYLLSVGMSYSDYLDSIRDQGRRSEDA